LFWITIPIGVPVVYPSWSPDLIDTSSGSPRDVVIIDWPGFRRSSSAWMSRSSSSTPAGQPDTVQPIASPCDSPNVVTRNSRPNWFPFIGGLSVFHE